MLYHPEAKQIVAFGKNSNNEVLDHIIPQLSCDEVVCEMVACYGMAVGKEVFETCVWIGRFWQSADYELKPFYRLKRLDVKLHMCGQPRAKDANIRQALVDKFGGKGTKKNPGPTYGISADVWQALALAVTWAERNNK